MPYKSIRDLDLAGKRIFIRVDFNVPLDETGTQITSDTRIRAALPTIKLALEKGAAIVLASHLGRPKGRPNPKMQLDPVAARLAELLGREVRKAPDSVGREVVHLASELSSGEVLLLENLRFHCGEATNDCNISEQLADLCDVYINDAFGAAHRAHASTEGLAHLLPAAAVDAHKGTRGHVAVFAASPGTTGAGHLACAAAARVGAGLVTLYVDDRTYRLVAPAARSTMCRRLDVTEGPDLQALLARHEALLVGPGWGLDGARRALLGELLEAPLPGVLDADGLTLLARLAAEEGQPRRLHGRWVLTPHPGEMGRLLGIPTAEVLADPAGAATAAADRWQATVILKGHVSYVARGSHAPAAPGQRGAASEGARLALLDAANAALGTGGAGDVLAGVVAGLLSRGLTPAAAARAGVLVHAAAARQALGAGGWFLAEDLLPHLGRAAWPGD